MSTNRHLFKNTAFLGIAQMLNYVAPLLLLPYLARVLSISSYGTYVAAFSLLSALNVISDFGINILGPYEVSKNIDKKKRLNQLLYSFTMIKLLVGAFCFSIPVTLSLFIESWHDESVFFTLIGACAFFNSLMPVWFLQGIQWVYPVMLSTFVTKIAFAISVIVTVNSDDDLWLAGICNMATTLVAALLLFGFILSKGYSIEHVGRSGMLRNLKLALPFFGSRAAVVSYTSLFPVLVNTLSGPLQSALYGASDQLYRAVQYLSSPIAQAIYPHAVQSRSARIPLRLSISLGVFSAFILGVFYLFGQSLVIWFLGEKYSDSYEVLLVLLLALVFSAPSQMLGFPAFGAIGHIKYANLSTLYGGLLSVILIGYGVLAGSFTADYAAWCVVFIEFVVLILRLYWFIKCTREIE